MQTVIPPRPKGGRRTWRWILLSTLGLFLFTVFMGELYHWIVESQSRKALGQAVARIERDDPDWHFEQIESRRAEVADEKNGGLRVLAAHKLMPKDWPRTAVTNFWSELPPERLLPPEQAKHLVDELTLHQDAITEAREVRRYRTGRYQVAYAKDYISTKVPHFDANRAVGFVLEADGVARAEWKDFDGAVESCQATLAVGQTFGDEWSALTLVTRDARRLVAVNLLQRILAQGEPSDGALNAIRTQFEEESQVRLLEPSLRCERAQFHRVFENLESGEITLGGADHDAVNPSLLTSTVDKLEHHWVQPIVLKSHAQFLQAATDDHEVSRLPEEQRSAAAALQKSRIQGLTPLGRLYLIPLERLVEADLRSMALLRCSVVALRAEQYRRKTGHWPAALSDLAADFPNGLPTDPFDGNPMRLKRLPDGLVIYSVGRDRTDDGGVLYRPDSKEVPGQGNDIGIRLWDVDKRRQPAMAAPNP
jgi:hypothetical protein